jgi:hypothetical protein
MRIATITGVAPDCFKVKIYDHAAALEDSRASTGTRPLVFRLIGSHHLAGTPRWRHFLRANSVTPSSSAALSTNSQSSSSIFPMPRIIKDDLSLRQGTIRGDVKKDVLSILVGVSNEESDSDHMALIRARTREARFARRWSTKEMADLLGVGEAAYKKYEERGTSTIPTRLIRRFCMLTGVDPGWLTACEASAEKRLTKS